MQNLTASVPHRLGRAEAKRRIQDGLGQLRRQYGTWLHDLRESWQGDRMDFTASALGQAFTGNLTVDDTAVHVEVALPWILDMLVEPIRQQIQQHGQKLLGRVG